MYLSKWFYGITGAYSNIYVTSKIIHAPVYSGAYVTFKPCPFHPHTDPHSAGLREVAALCMTVGALKNGILQIWRRCLTTKNLRILALFQICDIPLPSTPNWLSKWINLFCLGIYTHILTASAKHLIALQCDFLSGSTYVDLHNAQSEEVNSLCMLVWSTYVEVEYCVFKKYLKFLRISWRILVLCDIVLPSAPNWRAKCHHFAIQALWDICVRVTFEQSKTKRQPAILWWLVL